VPAIDYFGQHAVIDNLYSYARVSSPQQLEEHGGEGIQRQIEAAQDFASQYGIPLDQMADLGKSGSSGKNLEEGSPLAVFRDLALKGKLKPNPGLLVESFSRLGRAPIDRALSLFLAIVCEGGVTLVTMEDRRIYTQASLRKNQGEIYQVSSAMWAARAQAESIGYYSKKSWRTRRGSTTNNRPSWIIIREGALALDEAKVLIIVRIFKMALTMGVDMITRTLNAENVPTLNTRQRERGQAAWLQASVLKLLRGRQALGLQEVGRYIDGKRVVAKGEYTEAYPAAIDKALFDAVQAKLDERKSGGVSNGRNVTHYSNLLGDLARCVCGGRMKLHSRQGGRYAYYGCSNAFVAKCANTKYHRLADVERDLFMLLASLTWPDDAPDDKMDDLAARLDVAERDAAKLQRNIDAMATTFADAPPSIRTAMARLAEQHTDKLAVVTRLERQLAVLRTAKPAEEQLASVQSLSKRLERLSGPALVEGRGKVAMALPTLFRAITFAPDRIDVTVNDGRVFRLGEWVAAGGVLYAPQPKAVEMVKGKRWASPIRKR
jgi:Recombinase/Resolvase, N terminal domain